MTKTCDVNITKIFKKNCIQRISNKIFFTVLQAARIVNDLLNSINLLNQTKLYLWKYVFTILYIQMRVCIGKRMRCV